MNIKVIDISRELLAEKMNKSILETQEKAKKRQEERELEQSRIEVQNPNPLENIMVFVDIANARFKK